MDECPKCGSKDLHTKYTQEGDTITSTSLCKVNDEFVYSIEYDYFWKVRAKKDHLKKHCRNCEHGWRENTLDAIRR